MTDTEALKELLAKVAKGDLREQLEFSPLAAAGMIRDANVVRAYKAYHGSLDAAKALHEAVLPGAKSLAVYLHNDDSPVIWHCDFYSDSQTVAHAENDNPARAWLTAILRALIAQTEGET